MGLDPYLPSYLIRPSTDKSSSYTIFFTQNGSEPDPRYTLFHPDPSAPAAKNVYSVALLDVHINEICFGEVFLRPEWSQPTLSAQEIRTQASMVPAPIPLIPSEFTIQLYNPDSQVCISEKQSTWGGNSYNFTMPRYTFRAPSNSVLDLATNDPTADPTTPLIKFSWRKESKLSTTMMCYMTGSSTIDDNSKKRGGREPDVPIAILENHYKNVVFYESNYHRVEIEDYKGLEVVILLTAAVLRDVYFLQKKDSFNTGETPRKNSGGTGLLGKKKSTPLLRPSNDTNAPGVPPRPGSSHHSHSQPAIPTRPTFMHNNATTPNLGAPSSLLRPNSSPARPGVPPPDPRTQWEIDAETARLRRAAENETRLTDQRRREREKAEEAERKRIKKMLDQEDRERRKREEEIEKETERLRKKYGDQSGMFGSRPNESKPPLPGRPAHGSSQSFGGGLAPGPYGSGAGVGASMSSFFHSAPGSSGQGQSQGPPPPGPKKRKSYFGLRNLSEDGGRTLNTKKSSIW
jgi:hypothetical protein